MFKFPLSVGVVLLTLAGCNDHSPPPEAEAASENAQGDPTSSNPTMPQAALTIAPTPQLLASICKAGIAESFGHSPSIMKVISNNAGVVRVRYKRPSDGKPWTNDCRLEGNRIIWRTVDVFGSNGPGVWRTRPDDEILTFEVKGDKVAISMAYPGVGDVSTNLLPLL